MGEKRRRLAARAGAKGKRAAAALAGRARALAARSQFGPALESLSQALRLAPQVDAHWAQFSELIAFFNFRHPVPERLRELLGRALEHPAVDPGNLVRPISSIALSRPDNAALEEPLLLRLFEDAVARDARLEKIIAEARRRNLFERNIPLAAAVAIAHQCYNSEYLIGESEAESAELRRLAPRDAQGYATYAAYRPLRTLPEAGRIAEELANTPLASLARRQIIEPREERRLRTEIPSMGAASGSVSAAVQAQYEKNPYPRWLRTQSAFDAAPLWRIAHELFPHTGAADKDRAEARILVAGCGTGQNAIGTARRFAPSRVLAVDLSLASLAYAKRKTLELGIGNIEYRQADLLALAGIDERFDLVEASGVLHHLEDPLKGWRILAGLVEPGGFMRIGLYSKLGRRHIAHARELIARHGFAADAHGIRSCRRAILESAGDELLARIARSEDFYSMSGCRDLLFHVQEHCFDLRRVATMLEQLGLAFLGFEFPDGGITAARYRARFPADARMVELGNWQRFEEANPDSFARMYQFWVRKPR